jgi:hypothetical protein
MLRRSEVVCAARTGAIVALMIFASSACRDAKDTGPANTNQPIVPNMFGSNGCSAPDVVFTVGSTPTPVALTTFVPTTDSQVCAARGGEVLYLTGSNGQIVAVDVSGPTPVEMQLVSSGRVATLLASVHVTQAPRLSGIAVFDRSTLLVVERTSNTILAVSRTMTNTVAFFAGQANVIPGFADGFATGQQGVARFSFDQPSMVCPSGDGRVFVADPGNHAIRVITGGIVFTATGQGTSGFADGSLGSALFDTPTGITIACNQTLIVSECGAHGFGNRLRGIQIGTPSVFSGDLQGSVFTILGNGTPVTVGGPIAGAMADGPSSPFVTTGDEIYWLDSASGVLRRASADGNVDCPLKANCTVAVGMPTFSPGHLESMAVTESGQLFVLDATAGSLVRVAP